MWLSKFQNSLVSKIFSLLVVLNFSLTQTIFADPDIFSTTKSDTLSPASRWKALTDNGIELEHLMMAQFELLLGTRMLHKVWDVTEVERALNNLYGARNLLSREREERYFEFLDLIRNEDGSLSAIFAIRSDPSKIFEMRYRDSTIPGERVEDADETDLQFGTLQYKDVFVSGDTYTIHERPDLFARYHPYLGQLGRESIAQPVGYGLQASQLVPSMNSPSGIEQQVPNEITLGELNLAEETHDGVKWLHHRVASQEPKKFVVIVEPIDLRAVKTLMDDGETEFLLLHPDTDRLLSRSQLIAPLREYSGQITSLYVFVNYDFNAEIFNLLPNLREIVHFSTGYNNTDTKEAQRRGILVTYAPGLLTNAMAELNMGLLLDAHYHVTDGLYDRDEAGADRTWPTLEELFISDDTAERSAAMAQVLWAQLLQTSLRLNRMYEFGGSPQFSGCGVGPTRTVLHNQLATDHDLGIQTKIGIYLPANPSESQKIILRQIVSFARAFGITTPLVGYTNGAGTPQYAQDLGIECVQSPEAFLSQSDYVITIPGMDITAAPSDTMREAAEEQGVSIIDASRIGVNPEHKMMLDRSLAGKRVRIIGVGRIGLATVKRALAFGVDIKGLDPAPSKEAIATLGKERFAKTKEELLREADYLLLAPALVEGERTTRGLIGDEELAMLQDTAVIINTSRGPIIDQDALKRNLIERPMLRAYLDVLVNEITPDAELIGLANVRCTGHTGSAVVLVRLAMAMAAVQEMIRIKNGEIPEYPVNDLRRVEEVRKRRAYLSDESREILRRSLVGEPVDTASVGLMCEDRFIQVQGESDLMEGMVPGSLVLAGPIPSSIDQDGSKTLAWLKSLSQAVQRVISAMMQSKKRQSGGPASSASRVARLLGGLNVRLVTSVGEDGRELVEQHRDLGIDMDAVNISAEKPTASTWAPQWGSERSFLHNIGASAELTIDHLNPAHFRGMKVVEFGGVELTGLMPDIDKALEMAKEARCITVLDTVIDPGRQWKAFRTKYGPNYLRKILANIDVFTPSIKEAQQIMADYLYPDDQPKADEIKGNLTPTELLYFFIEHGAKAVFLKVGDQGVYVATTSGSIFKEDALFRVPSLQGFREVSGTGTGDAFAGAMVWAAANGWTDARKTAMFANVVGGMCVQNQGGTIGNESLVDALYYMERLRAQMLAEAIACPDTRAAARAILAEEKAKGNTRLIDQVEREVANVLYARAFPQATALRPESDIERADFSLNDFDTVGLLLEVVSIYNEGEGRGHTGKVLINAPEQLLIEHLHKTVVVLAQGTAIPAGYKDIEEVLGDEAYAVFEGLPEYNSDGTVAGIRYAKGSYTFAVADTPDQDPKEDFRAEDIVEVIEGKSETFMAVYGEGVLLADTAEVLYAPEGFDPEDIPADWQEKIDQLRQARGDGITTQRVIRMVPGVVVLLPKNTKHAFLAGTDGAVYIEFSGPSLDPADDFTEDITRNPPPVQLEDGQGAISLADIVKVYSDVTPVSARPAVKPYSAQTLRQLKTSIERGAKLSADSRRLAASFLDPATRKEALDLMVLLGISKEVYQNCLGVLLERGVPYFPFLSPERVTVEPVTSAEGITYDQKLCGRMSSTIVTHYAGTDIGHVGRVVGGMPYWFTPPQQHPASGTIKAVTGSAILFVDEGGYDILRTPPVFDPADVPVDLAAAYTDTVRDLGMRPRKRDMIYLVPGVEVRIHKGARYAFFSGNEGFAALEFTSPIGMSKTSGEQRSPAGAVQEGVSVEMSGVELKRVLQEIASLEPGLGQARTVKIYKPGSDTAPYVSWLARDFDGHEEVVGDNAPVLIFIDDSARYSLVVQDGIAEVRPVAPSDDEQQSPAGSPRGDRRSFEEISRWCAIRMQHNIMINESIVQDELNRVLEGTHHTRPQHAFRVIRNLERVLRENRIYDPNERVREDVTLEEGVAILIGAAECLVGVSHRNELDIHFSSDFQAYQGIPKINNLGDIKKVTNFVREKIVTLEKRPSGRGEQASETHESPSGLSEEFIQQVDQALRSHATDQQIMGQVADANWLPFLGQFLVAVCKEGYREMTFVNYTASPLTAITLKGALVGSRGVMTKILITGEGRANVPGSISIWNRSFQIAETEIAYPQDQEAYFRSLPKPVEGEVLTLSGQQILGILPVIARINPHNDQARTIRILRADGTPLYTSWLARDIEGREQILRPDNVVYHVIKSEEQYTLVVNNGVATVTSPPEVSATVPENASPSGVPEHGRIMTIVQQAKGAETIDVAAYNTVLFTHPSKFIERKDALRISLASAFSMGDSKTRYNLMAYLLETIDLENSFATTYTLQNTDRFRDYTLSDEELRREIDADIELLESWGRREFDLMRHLLGSQQKRLMRIQLPNADAAQGVGLLAIRAAAAPTDSFRGWLDHWKKLWQESNLRQLKNRTKAILGNDYGIGTEMLIKLGCDLVMMNPTLAIRALQEDLGLNAMIDELVQQHPDWTGDQLAQEATAIAGLRARKTLRAIFLLTGGKRGRVSFQVNPRNYDDQDAMEGQLIELYERFCEEADEYDSEFFAEDVLTEADLRGVRGRSHTFFKIDSSSSLVYGRLEDEMLEQVEAGAGEPIILATIETGGVIDHVTQRGLDTNGTIAYVTSQEIALYFAQIIGHAKVRDKGGRVLASIITNMAGRLDQGLRGVALQMVIERLEQQDPNDPRIAEFRLLKKNSKLPCLDNPELRAAAEEVGLTLPSDKAIRRAGVAVIKRSHEIIKAIAAYFQYQGVEEDETGLLLAAVRPPDEDGLYHGTMTAGMYSQGYFPDAQQNFENQEGLEVNPHAIDEPLDPLMIRELYESCIGEEWAKSYELNEAQARILEGLGIYQDSWGRRGYRIFEFPEIPGAQETLFGTVVEQYPQGDAEKDAVADGFIGDYNKLVKDLVRRQQEVQQASPAGSVESVIAGLTGSPREDVKSAVFVAIDELHASTDLPLAWLEETVATFFARNEIVDENGVLRHVPLDTAVATVLSIALYETQRVATSGQGFGPAGIRVTIRTQAVPLPPFLGPTRLERWAKDRLYPIAIESPDVATRRMAAQATEVGVPSILSQEPFARYAALHRTGKPVPLAWMMNREHEYMVEEIETAAQESPAGEVVPRNGREIAECSRIIAARMRPSEERMVVQTALHELLNDPSDVADGQTALADLYNLVTNNEIADTVMRRSGGVHPVYASGIRVALKTFLAAASAVRGTSGKVIVLGPVQSAGELRDLVASGTIEEIGAEMRSRGLVTIEEQQPIRPPDEMDSPSGTSVTFDEDPVRYCGETLAQFNIVTGTTEEAVVALESIVASSAETEDRKNLILGRLREFLEQATVVEIEEGLQSAWEALPIGEQVAVLASLGLLYRGEVGRIVLSESESLELSLPEIIAQGLDRHSLEGLMDIAGIMESERMINTSGDQRSPAGTETRNQAVFDERLATYQEAYDRFQEVLPEEEQDPAKVRSARDAAHWAREELFTESQKTRISDGEKLTLKVGMLLCDQVSKRVWRYNGGPLSQEVRDRAQNGLVVSLTPLELSDDVRTRRDDYIRVLSDSKQTVDARQQALVQLKKMEFEELLPAPYPSPDVFVHCHTTFSYGPTIEFMAWRAYQLGLGIKGAKGAVGIVDHNTNRGIRRWRQAARILGIVRHTSGVEVWVKMAGEFADKTINWPNVKGEAYMVVHAVHEEDPVPEFDDIGTSSAGRFRKTFDFMNKRILRPKVLNAPFRLNYERDVTPLLEPEADNPMERHAAEAIAQKIIDTIPMVRQRARFMRKLIAACEQLSGVSVTPLTAEEQKRSTMGNVEKLLVIIRDKVIVPLRSIEGLIPDEKECMSPEALVAFAHRNGWKVKYPELGGGEQGVCEAEAPEVVDALMDHMIVIGVDGIAFMPNRNTPTERVYVRRKAPEFHDKRPSAGMDVNKKKGMAYTSEFSADPEFILDADEILERERSLMLRTLLVKLTGRPEQEVTTGMMDTLERVEQATGRSGDELLRTIGDFVANNEVVDATGVLKNVSIRTAVAMVYSVALYQTEKPLYGTPRTEAAGFRVTFRTRAESHSPYVGPAKLENMVTNTLFPIAIAPTSTAARETATEEESAALASGDPSTRYAALLKKNNPIPLAWMLRREAQYEVEDLARVKAQEAQSPAGAVMEAMAPAAGETMVATVDRYPMPRNVDIMAVARDVVAQDMGLYLPQALLPNGGLRTLKDSLPAAVQDRIHVYTDLQHLAGIIREPDRACILLAQPADATLQQEFQAALKTNPGITRARFINAETPEQAAFTSAERNQYIRRMLAIMVLARMIDRADVERNSSVYTFLRYYLHAHLPEGMSAEGYIMNLITATATEEGFLMKISSIINAMLSYRPIEAYTMDEMEHVTDVLWAV